MISKLSRAVSLLGRRRLASRFSRYSLACLALWPWLVSPRPMMAHPMGNFSISQYSKLTIGPAALELLYIIDMAEVPTFQEKGLIDSNGDGTIDETEKKRYLGKKAEELSQGLDLRLNGDRCSLERVSEQFDLVPGGMNLPTLKLALRFRFAWDGAGLKETNTLDFRDRNFPGRVGWKEIVAQSSAGVELEESSVPANDLSQELNTYPQDPAVRPPQDLEARVRFRRQPSRLAASATGSPSPDSGARTRREPRRLTQPLPAAVLSSSAILLGLIAVCGLGAFAWYRFIRRR